MHPHHYVFGASFAKSGVLLRGLKLGNLLQTEPRGLGYDIGRHTQFLQIAGVLYSFFLLPFFSPFCTSFRTPFLPPFCMPLRAPFL